MFQGSLFINYLRQCTCIWYISNQFWQARSEDFKRGGQDFKCCCVQENFEKLTLSGAFSDHFSRKGGWGARDGRPPLWPPKIRGLMQNNLRRDCFWSESKDQIIQVSITCADNIRDDATRAVSAKSKSNDLHKLPHTMGVANKLGGKVV